MGADAELFVFDAERYRAEVVPALVRLLRTGEPVPWLAEVFGAATGHDEYGYHLSWPQLAARCAEQPTDLARHCTWLGADLRYPGPGPRNPRTLTCPSTTCPERERCLFHQERHAVEELNALHEALVATRCLGRSQFLGRTVTPSVYTPVLDRLGVAADDRLRTLLAALGTRGAVVGHQFCGTDGIHGWLTGPETTELAGRLGALPLPRYPATFAAMAELHGRRGHTAESWPAVSLSFVRTVAVIAAAGGRGVLWGNDVCPGVWTDTHGVVTP